MKALIIVDMQNDFITGSLAVPDAESLVDDIVKKAKHGNYDYLIFTRDSHPNRHISFASYHGVEPFTELNYYDIMGLVTRTETVWPDHCVVGTEGHKIHHNLLPYVEQADLVVDKATTLNQDAYSGFDGTNLAEWLRSHNVDSVEIIGLALDFCVKATAIDAIKEGFKTTVIVTSTRSVFPDNDEQTLIQLRDAGVVRMYEGFFVEG